MAGTRAFNLAVVQMYVEPGAKSRNLDHACALISRAASSGAEIILLPEALTTGWTDPSTASTADEIPNGESCTILSDAARSHGVHLCAGIVERHDQNLFNTAVVIDPDGNVILRHRKIYELEIAHGIYALGDRLSVVETPF